VQAMFQRTVLRRLSQAFPNRVHGLWLHDLACSKEQRSRYEGMPRDGGQLCPSVFEHPASRD
jgi:hypothetical protein